MKKTFATAMLLGAFLSVLGCDKDQRDSTPEAQAHEAGAVTKPKELVLDLGDKVTLKLVQIPAGKFTMGSPEMEKAAVKEALAAGRPGKYTTGVSKDKDEIRHEVTISQPFHMGITPVTVDQFAAFVKDSGYKPDAEKAGYSTCLAIKDGKFDLKVVEGLSWRNPGFDQKGDHPVV